MMFEFFLLLFGEVLEGRIRGGRHMMHEGGKIPMNIIEMVIAL
jgi:hypothetical protein